MKYLFLIALNIALLSCKNSEQKQEQKEVKQKRATEDVLERFPNGAKKLEGQLVNGERHGNWKAYYENGLLWSEGSYWHGKRRGFSSIYYNTGKVKMEGNYANDLKVGMWKVYASDGSLVKTINMYELLTKEDLQRLKE